MRLLIATTNQHKVREIRSILAGTDVELIGLGDLAPVEEPEETGDSFAENARLKALYYAGHAGILTVAEDSGLVIDAMGGDPGVRSARFLGPDATYAERFEAILAHLAAHPERPRSARFICAVAVAEGNRIVFETEGSVEGSIAEGTSGAAGFGYDPIFYYPPYGATLAEVSEPQKLAVAHRGQAFRALGQWLTRPDATPTSAAP